MALKFSPKTVEAIGYYVYILVDPLNNAPFYVGKGTGNRVFSHVVSVKKKNGVNLNDAKELHINSIIQRPNPAHNQVIHYIVRYGLTHEHALLIESVLIDVFNHKLKIKLDSSNSLTNIYSGFYSDNGCITADDLERSITGKKVQFDKTKKYLAININYLPTGPDAELEIYKKVRWCWVLKPCKANQADYILAIHGGVIVGVYKLDGNGWQLVPNQPTYVVKKRYFFDQDMSANLTVERKALIGCRLSNKPRGAQNPVWYVYGW